jgi:hypothetical protein
LSSPGGLFKWKVEEMKKKIVIIVALLVFATMLLVPVSAKITDPPPSDPLSNIIGICTDILTALGVLQADVADIKSATTGNVVYSTYILPGAPPDDVTINLRAPGITEDVDVEIQVWWNSPSPDDTYEDTQQCGTDGHLILTPEEQINSCTFDLGPQSKIVKIIVQKEDSHKIIPSLIVYEDGTSNERIKYLPTDFKVDQM